MNLGGRVKVPEFALLSQRQDPRPIGASFIFQIALLLFILALPKVYDIEVHTPRKQYTFTPLTAYKVAPRHMEQVVHAPKIKLESPADAGEHLRSISVLEIINDDMPFLVDSVLGELADRGVEALLVAHPVISVTRDAAGRVKSFGENGNGAARRESIIHIHIGRIEVEEPDRTTGPA